MKLTKITPLEDQHITIDDVKRWQAMEARLEAYIEQLSKEPKTFVKDALIKSLIQIKDGAND